jgi:hypothetical protein
LFNVSTNLQEPLMAAELAYDSTGAAQMFYSKQGGTPWHSEGTPIDGDKVFDFDGAMATKVFPEGAPGFIRGEESGRTPAT